MLVSYNHSLLNELISGAIFLNFSRSCLDSFYWSSIMNTLSLVSPLSLLSTSDHCPHSVQLHLLSSHSFRISCCRLLKGHFPQSYVLPFTDRPRLQKPHFSVSATLPQDDSAVSVMNFEDLVEKDWSVLEFDSTNTKEERDTKFGRVISAGNIVDTSRILVSMPSDDFLDTMVDTKPCQLLLVLHDSLLSLACMKERHDRVKCWQGGLIHVPVKWAPFDVIFLYFFPALPFNLDEIFSVLANRCSPGARVVISHLQGRQSLEQQKQQYFDIIVSDLPDKQALQKVGEDHSFVINEYVDDPGLYLAVLQLNGPT